mgnify:CR=1 FL=1
MGLRHEHTYKGWLIRPGAYYGTSGNVAGTWYIAAPNTDLIDMSGEGYATLGAARQAIDDEINYAERQEAIDAEWREIARTERLPENARAARDAAARDAAGQWPYALDAMAGR